MKMAIVCHELLGRDLIKIYQDTDCFNFSIDSLLLASFATISYKTLDICDLCSGNAPVALYLSLRSNANIVGVEVQRHSYDLACMSIKENKLEDRITMFCDNLIDIHNKVTKFDLVTCNPPFFKLGNHNVNPNDSKAIARHEVLASLDDIVKESSLILKSKGRFAMVHRPDRLIEVIDTFRKYHIEPKRLQFVYPKMNKECNHILIEGIKDGSNGGLRVLPPLYVYNEMDQWTDQILEIYNFERK